MKVGHPSLSVVLAVMWGRKEYVVLLSWSISATSEKVTVSLSTDTKNLNTGYNYHHMQVDIAQNKFIDLVYACYHLCHYLWELGSPIEEISKHISGLYLRVKRVLGTRDMTSVSVNYCMPGVQSQGHTF